MTQRRALLAALALLGSVALAGAAHATPVGAATLHGGHRLKVKSCGRTGGPVSFDFAIGGDGSWTIATGVSVYSGSAWGNRRVARLIPDAASLAALEAMLEAEASALCGEPVDLESLHTLAALKVNKRQTRARIFIRVGASAESATRHGRAIYKARARSSWMPAPAS